MKHPFILFFIILLMAQCTAVSQIDIDTSENKYLAIDSEHKLIIWNINDPQFTSRKISKINIDNQLFTLKKAQKISEEKTAILTNNDVEYTLYPTSLPLIQINTTEAIVDEPKKMGSFKYADKDTTFIANIGVELRGNLAQTYPKKSYDMEFRETATSEESVDVHFGNMRNDDDWILIGLYNQPLKFRSYITTKLWLDIYSPAYAEEEPKAKSGADVEYVEVFENNQYKGLYLLGEQVDRKQLKLKSFKDNVVRGELFSSKSYEDGTKFLAAPPFKNHIPRWSGFDMEYPYENYEAHFDNLHDFVSFVATADDASFTSEISNKIDIANAVEYFLYVNILRATDNLGKNYFFAKYEQGTPYFFVPWDTDGTLGTVMDGRRSDITYDILKNNLFERLLKTNASDFKGKVKARWEELRNNQYSEKELMNRMEDVYNKFTKSHIYEREQKLWGNLGGQEDFDYTKQWLENRLIFLDKNFSRF
ncbi:MAG: CotH kinase family protein [Patiriisocius sp.]|uniref:CotH kinase family protein n=1 Tax=Patiriisocius sp. TaxID=2822396 RepID=UPI003EF453B3